MASSAIRHLRLLLLLVLTTTAPGWQCYNYLAEQTDEWCASVGEKEGYRYAFTAGDNTAYEGCEDCWCCRTATSQTERHIETARETAAVTDASTSSLVDTAAVLVFIHVTLVSGSMQSLAHILKSIFDSGLIDRVERISINAVGHGSIDSRMWAKYYQQHNHKVHLSYWGPFAWPFNGVNGTMHVNAQWTWNQMGSLALLKWYNPSQRSRYPSPVPPDSGVAKQYTYLYLPVDPMSFKAGLQSQHAVSQVLIKEFKQRLMDLSSRGRRSGDYSSVGLGLYPFKRYHLLGWWASREHIASLPPLAKWIERLAHPQNRSGPTVADWVLDFGTQRTGSTHHKKYVIHDAGSASTPHTTADVHLDEDTILSSSKTDQGGGMHVENSEETIEQSEHGFHQVENAMQQLGQECADGSALGAASCRECELLSVVSFQHFSGKYKRYLRKRRNENDGTRAWIYKKTKLVGGAPRSVQLYLYPSPVSSTSIADASSTLQGWFIGSQEQMDHDPPTGLITLPALSSEKSVRYWQWVPGVNRDLSLKDWPHFTQVVCSDLDSKHRILRWSTISPQTGTDRMQQYQFANTHAHQHLRSWLAYFKSVFLHRAALSISAPVSCRTFGDCDLFPAATGSSSKQFRSLNQDFLPPKNRRIEEFTNTGLVGIFLLKSPSRKFGLVLIKTLHTLWLQSPHLAKRLRLHVLVHDTSDYYVRANTDDPMARWEVLLHDTPMMGGVHFVTDYNPLSKARESDSVSALHQNNYIHKMMTALQLAEQNRYEFMLSMDDDIFMPPAVLEYMLRHTHVLGSTPIASDSTNQQSGCYYLTPTLSSGIPTVGMWAQSFLTMEQRKQIEKCYAANIFGQYAHNTYHTLNPVPNPWNEWKFYESVKNRVRTHKMKGIHPVRVNNTCMDQLHSMVLANLGNYWMKSVDFSSNETSTDQGKFSAKMTIKVLGYDKIPYLCNSVYAIRTEVYRRMMNREELAHRYDELPANLDAQERGMQHCIVDGAFVIHPGYNTNPRCLRMETEVFHEIMQLF